MTADSPENLERNLAELCGARVLNLPEQAAQEQELQVAAVLRWLEKQRGWLMILDNVDSPEAAKAVDHLLPALHNGHVLITSRRTDWGNSIYRLPLDTLDEDDAVAFLLEKTADNRTRTDTDVAAARTLAQTLDGLALALEQAGAFINSMHLSIETYQQRWAQQEAKLRDWYDEQVMHYPKSLATTWETSFEQLTAEAQALLNVLSWFAPEPIPRESFAAAYKGDPTAALMVDAGSDNAAATQPSDMEDLLHKLESLSLLKWEIGYRSFSVHRLVQEITRARLGDDARERSLRAAIELVDAALRSETAPSDVRAWPVWDPLRPHLERLIPAADDAGIADPTTRLMNGLGQYLEAKGLYREAEPLMRRALDIDEASLGPEHPRVAIRLSNLALLLQATNRLAEAEPLSRRHVEIFLLFTMRTGHEHPHLNAALRNYMGLLAAMGHDEEASKVAIESLVETALKTKDA